MTEKDFTLILKCACCNRVTTFVLSASSSEDALVKYADTFEAYNDLESYEPVMVFEGALEPVLVVEFEDEATDLEEED